MSALDAAICISIDTAVYTSFKIPDANAICATICATDWCPKHAANKTTNLFTVPAANSSAIIVSNDAAVDEAL